MARSSMWTVAGSLCSEARLRRYEAGARQLEARHRVLSAVRCFLCGAFSAVRSSQRSSRSLRVERLRKAFDTRLSDALDHRAPTFTRRLTEQAHRLRIP